MENDKLLSMIGMSLKAGQLLQGTERVKDNLRRGKVVLVLLAKDLSNNTKKSMRYNAQEWNTPVVDLPVTMSEIGQRTGKKTGVLALTDRGFAGAVTKILSTK